MGAIRSTRAEGHRDYKGYRVRATKEYKRAIRAIRSIVGAKG